jgi:hypothetical protein
MLSAQIRPFPFNYKQKSDTLHRGNKALESNIDLQTFLILPTFIRNEVVIYTECCATT